MRSKEEITKEYSDLCAKAGDLSYRLLCWQAELDETYNRMREINKEASELPKEETKND